MRSIPFSQGQPYLDAVDGTADASGAWIQTDGLRVLTFEVEHAITSGTVTSDFYIECTAQLSGAVSSGSRILLPAGSLHTDVSEIELDTAVSATMGSLKVTMTAAGAGRFLVTLSDIPSGQIRAVYDYGSNAAAVGSTITVYLSGWGD